MAVELGPVPSTHEVITPVVLPDLREPLTDTADISEARINPDLLKLTSEPSNVVNGKPPGFLSDGDWIVLNKYSKSFNEPPMGVHNPAECPHCIHNRK